MGREMLEGGGGRDQGEGKKGTSGSSTEGVCGVLSGARAQKPWSAQQAGGGSAGGGQRVWSCSLGEAPPGPPELHIAGSLGLPGCGGDEVGWGTVGGVHRLVTRTLDEEQEMVPVKFITPVLGSEVSRGEKDERERKGRVTTQSGPGTRPRNVF